MNIDVEKMAQLLSEEEGLSMGVFEIDKQPAVGVLFCRAEYIPKLEEFTKKWIEEEKAKKA